MATQESPVRINSVLMAQVQAAAETFNRKAPDQLTHWANIGRLVESKLSVNELSALFAGIADIQVVVGSFPDPTPSQNRSAPLSIVEMARANQTDSAFEKTAGFIAAKSSGFRYEGVHGSPGSIRRISADGTIDVGTFKNGKFRKATKLKMACEA